MDYIPNRMFARWLYGPAVDGVAAISKAVADALASAGVARERITVIPSGVDCAHFRPPSADERAQARAALGLGEGDLAIGAVGALEPRKGHRYLVEAMARLGRAAGAGGGALGDFVAERAASRAAVAIIGFAARSDGLRARRGSLA